MALEGPQCAGVGIAPSGLAAITTTLLAVLKAGDHLLVCDNVYRPSRNFCNGLLARYGVETSYFDPLIGSGIASLFKPNTRAVLIEAPGSQSFEMPDIRAIAAAAHAHSAIVIDDNTWATPLFHRSLEQGVDISIQAATKYIGGHSDIMFGTISANAKDMAGDFRSDPAARGLCRPDDVFLAIRGLRTLAVRLAQHHRSGLEMAQWLASRPEVLRVLHPALESDPGHAIWKRDFTGASGLFGIVLKPVAQKAVDAMLNSLKLFGMGYSWGGFESLIIPFDCSGYRTATEWAPGGPTLRLHIGLENVEDLKADLARGFEALRASLEKTIPSVLFRSLRAALEDQHQVADIDDIRDQLADDDNGLALDQAVDQRQQRRRRSRRTRTPAGPRFFPPVRLRSTGPESAR